MYDDDETCPVCGSAVNEYRALSLVRHDGELYHRGCYELLQEDLQATPEEVARWERREGIRG